MTNQMNAQDVNEYDDLTRFADENFDTGEVDLFQFTGDDQSPLTKLKAVILSLDWDITDEYLQELAEELDNLTESWQDDKVAALYLQGMGKIGKYLRLRGAHAHPNAIKLLLSFFYDFELIFSSPDISSAKVSRMVQNDVHKFKVLQYQIQLAEEAEEEKTKALKDERATGKASEPLRKFKAAILELDWEITDSSLAEFEKALKELGEAEIENKAALLLIHGMQALGQYIAEERAHAHPGVFNLLHAFHDGLEQILDTGPTALTQQQKKNILVDRINRLNQLKTVIATGDQAPSAGPEASVTDAPEPVADDDGEPVLQLDDEEALPDYEKAVPPDGESPALDLDVQPLQTAVSSEQEEYKGEFEVVDEQDSADALSMDELPAFKQKEADFDSPVNALDIAPLQTTTELDSHDDDGVTHSLDAPPPVQGPSPRH